jgi:4'-phosphopantetheinyl transferase
MKLLFTRLGKNARATTPPSTGSHVGSVHVWTHSITKEDAFLQLSSSTISKEESDRALRYHSDRDRNIYLIGHVFIRKVLSHYTQIAPQVLALSPVVNTKPVLLNAPFPFHFNISHCGNRILIAVSFDTEVGIDVEELVEDFDMDGFSENNYHPNEITEMERLDGDDQTDYFYTIWTRKEAWLKLTGEGTNDHLRDYDFSGLESSPKGVEWNHDIHMISWRESSDYLATLATSHSHSSVEWYDSTILI